MGVRRVVWVLALFVLFLAVEGCGRASTATTGSRVGSGAGLRATAPRYDGGSPGMTGAASIATGTVGRVDVEHDLLVPPTAASPRGLATEDEPYAEYDEYGDEPTSQPMKPRGSGSPNYVENQQANYAADQAGLNQAERQTFHRLITGQNLSSEELQQIAHNVKSGDY